MSYFLSHFAILRYPEPSNIYYSPYITMICPLFGLIPYRFHQKKSFNSHFYCLTNENASLAFTERTFSLKTPQ